MTVFADLRRHFPRGDPVPDRRGRDRARQEL